MATYQYLFPHQHIADEASPEVEASSAAEAMALLRLPENGGWPERLPNLRVLQGGRWVWVY